MVKAVIMVGNDQGACGGDGADSSGGVGVIASVSRALMRMPGITDKYTCISSFSRPRLSLGGGHRRLEK